MINGVLQTAHSLFKRYRFEFKSQELWEEIKFVLDKLAKPLTDLLLVNNFCMLMHFCYLNCIFFLFSPL